MTSRSIKFGTLARVVGAVLFAALTVANAIAADRLLAGFVAATAAAASFTFLALFIKGFAERDERWRFAASSGLGNAALGLYLLSSSVLTMNEGLPR
ncbi:hypothetical protein [Sphingosinicella sp. BN140058]|uniref:hypothetical protein n=1 Tax=Sphingosinicella sp. BN140058 TaxID=1892855 RepID=UPI00101054DA|nr:hypothetical protein [Sphingosinicella sp. BN140058]QAY80333.1 hypothetical protein ETR14_27200 [Sphingosinicella sp. BN140058]